MKFCENCENMFYIHIDEKNANNLNYFCRHCGNLKDDLEGSLCIINTNVNKSDTSFEYIVNEFTKLDPTLPRVNNVVCPNSECSTNPQEGEDLKEREIIYIRYNNTDMKYLYLCSTCDHIWKADDK